MARIRTIKPDFWTDGNIIRLSPFARLLFIGMWNFTMCDHGHVADDAMKLKLQVLPGDDVDIDALLMEIMTSGRVRRIASDDGRTYLHIVRFEDHQKIDPRWKTRCPACKDAEPAPPRLTDTPRDSPELTGAHPNSQQLPLGREGKGREGIKTPSSPATPPMEFDTFWARYPRKVGKQGAVKAYQKALKVTTAEKILSGLDLLKTQTAGKDAEFIPHPTSWLNAGRWDDEPTTPTKPTAASPWNKEFFK